MLSVYLIVILLLLTGNDISAFRMQRLHERWGSPIQMTSNSGIDTKKKVLIAGATGYIGKYVAKESIRRGYETYAIVRPNSKIPNDFLEGAKLIYCDVTDPNSLANSELKDIKLDVMISCLASRSGVKSDSFAIDYQATSNVLQQGIKTNNIDQFILLSAFCVRKPLLQFQKAKLLFENELIEAQKLGKLSKYSIVRPTAFFKSVSGQFEIVQQGYPFVMFGDGKICQCNPIAETDLADYMLNCIHQSDKWNQILNLGGPDEGMTMKQQGDMLFEILGKEPKFINAPIQIFDYVIGFLAFLGKFFPNMEDAAELGRIGKYYAVEDMLTTKPNEKYGKVTLRQHYERIKVEGQEYDPYTTVLGSKKA